MNSTYAGMGADTKAQKPFPLLQLPRELRDRIYEYALVDGQDLAISIGSTRKRYDLWRNEEPPFQKKYSDFISDPIHRTSFACTLERRNFTYVNGNGLACFEMKVSAWDEIRSEPELSLFHTNRQCYQEASDIFYSKNLFSFDVGLDSLACCLAFLKDRPTRAMRQIRSIGLKLGQPAFKIYAFETSTAPLLEKFWDEMKLHRLDLSFHGILPDVRQTPWKWPIGDLSLAKQDRIETFIEGLIQIPKLKRLSIALYFRQWNTLEQDQAVSARVLQAARVPAHFVALLRAGMLKNGERLGINQIGHDKHFWEEDLPTYFSDDDEFGKSRLLETLTLSTE
jgi:hypothetical protein